MARIQSTTDYGMFNSLVANRALNPIHLINIVRSLKVKNLLHLNPIIVNERNEVIDGQHRLAAAAQLHIPIYYMKDKNITIADVRLLNTNVKGWGMTDFLQTFIAEGHEDYKYLVNFQKKHSLSISTAVAILSLNINSSYFRAPYKLFRNGEFKVIDKGLADDFVVFYKTVAKYTEENTFRDRDFIGALWHVYRNEEIDPEEFLDKVPKFPQPIYRRANTREYIRQFEDILNYGAKSRDYIRLS
jgi:hypothetical protein